MIHPPVQPPQPLPMEGTNGHPPRVTPPSTPEPPEELATLPPLYSLIRVLVGDGRVGTIVAWVDREAASGE